MITEEDFLAMAKARPELMRAFHKVVNAVIEFRKAAVTNQSSLWAKARLKKKAFTAIFLTGRFTDGFVFNGKPISEEEKKLIQNWIVGAADFQMLPKEEQEKNSN
jgi:hypothetical protein